MAAAKMSDDATKCADIEAADVYRALVEFANTSEIATWNRFYSFLTGNSILVLAWATLFVASKSHSGQIVLVTIAMLGIAGGVVFCALGRRGRAFGIEYVRLGRSLESEVKGSIKIEGPFTASDRLRENAPHAWSGSYYTLSIGAAAFAVLHLVLLAVTIVTWFLSGGWPAQPTAA